MRKEIEDFEGHLTADEDYWDYVYSDDTEWNTKVNSNWYNTNHIDYRGLIEKGLGIEATTDMYNIKN